MEDLDNFNQIDPDINHFEYNPHFETHSITSFSEKLNIDKKSLKIIHHNARSLMKPGRMDEYHMYFQTLKNPFDILVFTETWLTNNTMGQCNFDGYQSIHLIRPTDNHIDFKLWGGGISIFIKDSLEYKHRHDLNIMLPHMECLFIEMKFDNQLYLIGGIYRIPKTSINSFIDHFNKLIEPLKSTHKLILLGDYNIDLKRNDNYKNEFELCLQSNYLIPTILKATRVATKILNDQEITSETLIDNILINYNTNYQSGIIESSITDHYSIYVMLPEITKITNTEPDIIKYRAINFMSQRFFNNNLCNSDIIQSLHNNNAESAYMQYSNIFDDVYNKSFPIKNKIISSKDKEKPWINDSLVSRLKIRDKLKNLANNKNISRKIYTDFRNKVTYQLRQAKAKYYDEKFEANAGNIKKTWEVINSVIKPKKVRPKVSLTDETGNKHKESLIPNTFKDYFTNTADKLT